MDLVGRKLGQAGGANFQAFMSDVGEFVAKHTADATFGPEVKKLGAGMEALGGSVMMLLGWFQSGRMEMVPLNANRLLEMISECTVGWMLLEGTVADANSKRDRSPILKRPSTRAKSELLVFTFAAFSLRSSLKPSSFKKKTDCHGKSRTRLSRRSKSFGRSHGDPICSLKTFRNVSRFTMDVRNSIRDAGGTFWMQTRVQGEVSLPALLNFVMPPSSQSKHLFFQGYAVQVIFNDHPRCGQSPSLPLSSIGNTLAEKGISTLKIQMNMTWLLSPLCFEKFPARASPTQKPG